ncbi:hypothetical protein [Haloarcula pelagica]|uniref:hypothetical protein n=1 Tax=Haloarcula pelagica TaxID=3033389 RepID=UPI0024C23D2A|nr:hypothetical protein [Halomicroarcula sp. YJ-61-S]
METGDSKNYSRRAVLRTAAGVGALFSLGTGVGAAQSTGGYGTGGYGAGGYGGRSPSSPVSRFDTNGQQGIQRSEVVVAIDAYDKQQQVGGRPVTAEDVMAVIAAYNS